LGVSSNIESPWGFSRSANERGGIDTLKVADFLAGGGEIERCDFFLGGGDFERGELQGDMRGELQGELERELESLEVKLAKRGDMMLLRGDWLRGVVLRGDWNGLPERGDATGGVAIGAEVL